METSTQSDSRSRRRPASRQRSALKGASELTAREHLVEEHLLRAIAHHLRRGGVEAH